MTDKTIKAVFPGQCAVCGRHFSKGQLIIDTGERGPRGGKLMAHSRCFKARQNPSYPNLMIPASRDFYGPPAKLPRLAHWSVDPEYSYEQFWRTNPARTSCKARRNSDSASFLRTLWVKARVIGNEWDQTFLTSCAQQMASGKALSKSQMNQIQSISAAQQKLKPNTNEELLSGMVLLVGKAKEVGNARASSFFLDCAKRAVDGLPLTAKQQADMPNWIMAVSGDSAPVVVQPEVQPEVVQPEVYVAPPEAPTAPPPVASPVASPRPSFAPDDYKYKVRFVNYRPIGGPWVFGVGSPRFGHKTREEAQKKADRQRQKDEARFRALEERAALEREGRVGRWGLDYEGRNKADRARFAEPMAAALSKVSGGSYTRTEVMRLLDRASPDAFDFVKRMLDAMWERQTYDEQAVGDAINLNLAGFNKGDASVAKRLVKELKSPISPERLREIHYMLAVMLTKYSGKQLINILEKDVAAQGYALRTNPSSCEAYPKRWGVPENAGPYIPQMFYGSFGVPYEYTFDEPKEAKKNRKSRKVRRNRGSLQRRSLLSSW